MIAVFSPVEFLTRVVHNTAELGTGDFIHVLITVSREAQAYWNHKKDPATSSTQEGAAQSNNFKHEIKPFPFLSVAMEDLEEISTL